MAFEVACPMWLHDGPIVSYGILRMLRSSLALLCHFTDGNKTAVLSADSRCRHAPLQALFEAAQLWEYSSAGATQTGTAKGMLLCRRCLGGRS